MLPVGVNAELWPGVADSVRCMLTLLPTELQLPCPSVGLMHTLPTCVNGTPPHTQDS